MGKILITSTGETLSSTFDKRFGRAAWFCIFNRENGQISFLENKYKEESIDSGIKVITAIKNMGINQIISGDFGRNVSKELNKLNIQMIIPADDIYIIEDIILRLK